VLREVAGLWPLGKDAEITLEANPGTLDHEKLRRFRAAGFKRLSLGVQSFEARGLETLGPAHRPPPAYPAIEWARASGFANINLDLIFAVPGQTLDMLGRDLAAALSLAPEHVAVYNLTYEPATPFFALREQGRITPASEEDEIAMYALVRERLAAAGYVHYEISNFARPGFVSRHNRNYWRGSDYLGVGAGAHSFQRRPGWGTRWSNERSPGDYMEAVVARGHARAFVEDLTRRQAAGEFVFLNLRQMEGLSPEAFRERLGGAGADLQEEYPQVADLVARGLLTWRGDRLALTPTGLLVADTIFASFF
jgi:oxygen-independent coproporphyrinogen-3 oxidase